MKTTAKAPYRTETPDPRYTHWDQPRCTSRLAVRQHGYTCTRGIGHEGEHVAHSDRGREVLAIWNGPAPAEAPHPLRARRLLADETGE